ncbi:glycosyl hydrolase family 18 protein [Bacillus cereus]|uniref:glycosyl hydrolase family 18 protein n=1 Tax=Bacillus cereus TaxID=1396 RepID=UPI0018CE70EF|nr:glycosyl hydrolase family 18 protein [Bacillus cereus]MBG9613514.1 spore gernimation protein [Bacillus cereus]
MLIHIIKSTDTLWGIASLYHVLPEAIMHINQLPNPDRLLIGQALIIPTDKKYHIIQPGETMFQIAQAYGVPLPELLQINQLHDPNYIYSGMQIIIPVNKPLIDVNAYTNTTGATAGKLVLEVGNKLTYVCPFAYIMKKDGSIEPIKDEEILTSAVRTNVSPMMCITNFTSRDPGSQLAHIILSNEDIQNRLLSNVINMMRAKGYQGLNIDFENTYPSDRELYNQFLQRAVDLLHRQGYYVSTALAPKTSAQQQGILYEAHDYAAHGRIVDFVVLMTYEWGYRLGPPQAISPIHQIKKVLDYAVSVIPKQKILMGMQFYARDWVLPHVQGKEAETFSMQEAIRRAGQYQVAIQYDQTTQSPFYRYIDEVGRHHEVWFEDARSTQAKFDMVKRYGLRGISYWVLGYPFPQNWTLLTDNFKIRKLR